MSKDKARPPSGRSFPRTPEGNGPAQGHSKLALETEGPRRWLSSPAGKDGDSRLTPC